MSRRLLLCLLLLLVSAPAWAVEIAPELNCAVSVTPTSGGPGTVIARVVLTTNTRQSTAPVVVQIGPVAGEVNGTPVEVTANFTITGLSGTRQVTYDMPVPAGLTLQPGSLKVAGVVQPDPVVANGYYSLSLTVPAATALTSGLLRVEDRLVVSTPVAELPEVRASVNTAALSLSDGLVVLSSALVGLLVAG